MQSKSKKEIKLHSKTNKNRNNTYCIDGMQYIEQINHNKVRDKLTYADIYCEKCINTEIERKRKRKKTILKCMAFFKRTTQRRDRRKIKSNFKSI